jgi:hypothetical protein
MKPLEVLKILEQIFTVLGGFSLLIGLIVIIIKFPGFGLFMLGITCILVAHLVKNKVKEMKDEVQNQKV